MSVEELPELDAVVLSHLHGDHFDRVARRGLARSQPVLTTPAAARRLRSWGFEAQGLRTWESETLTRGNEMLTVTSLPAIHARGLMGALLPPVMGSMLEHRSGGVLTRRVYVSGDTLTGEHISEIAERYTDIDTAVVHLGGTRVLLHTVTMDAVQGVDFLRRVRPATAIPVHYDDYGVFRSPLSAFEQEARAAGFAEGLVRVARGETTESRRGTHASRRHRLRGRQSGTSWHPQSGLRPHSPWEVVVTTAREIMSGSAECARTTDTLVDAAKKMRELEVGGLPICGEDDRLKGLITDRDIVTQCVATGKDPGSVKVEEFVSEAVTIGADDSIEEALRTMTDHGVRRLPVIDGHDLIGIVSQADIAKNLSDDKVADLVEAISKAPAN